MAKTAASCPLQSVISCWHVHSQGHDQTVFLDLPSVRCCHVTQSYHRMWADVMHTSSRHKAGMPAPHLSTLPMGENDNEAKAWRMVEPQGGRMLGPHPHMEESDLNQTWLPCTNIWVEIKLLLCPSHSIFFVYLLSQPSLLYVIQCLIPFLGSRKGQGGCGMFFIYTILIYRIFTTLS